jgi:hypothetical protein
VLLYLSPKLSPAILPLLFVEKLSWSARVWRSLLRKKDTRRPFFENVWYIPGDLETMILGKRGKSK